jgi:hypothetical protein
MVIYNSGTVRLNMIIAQIAGALAFHFTMGKYISKLSELSAKMLSKTFVLIFSPVIFISRKLTLKLNVFKEKIKPDRKTYPEEKTKKKKIMNILKIHLKN